VVYTLKYNSADGYYFNVARFKVTYMDVDVVGPSTKVPAPTKKMERIYEERFNYNRPGTTNFAFWLGHFDVDESTYGYYDKNLDGDPSYRHVRKGNITWSEYAVTNKKAVWVSSGTTPYVYQHVDSADNVSANAKEGYMLYCDGSQQPGLVFNLKVNADLCPGSTMYFSAWLCDGSSTGDSNKSAPNLDFIVTGIDDEGKEHALTTFTTGEFGINAVNKVGQSGKMERTKWYQIMFPVKFDTKATYPSYRLKITNKSTSSDGNDFAIDDIRIYVQKAPVMPIQASTSDCIDRAVDSIRAYLRIDYQGIDDESDSLFYQWREGDRIIRNAYFNKDSVDKKSNTFGCIPILRTDEAIVASGLTSDNLLAFDGAYRETKDPIYRYIKEKIDATTERYVLYVAQAIEVSMNHNYTGFVATRPEDLGDRNGCGTFEDMIISGGTRIIIDDHITLGDSVVSMCGHRTYTLNIVLTKIIQDETDPDDPLKADTTHCKADWLIGDSTYVNENTSDYGGKNFDEIERALQIYRGNSVPPEIRAMIENLVSKGKLILDTASITMQPSLSLSYTAFPLDGSAGEGKKVCTSPRFLHIRPSTEIATMMAVGSSTEELPRAVANRPRITRISNAQKLRDSFELPLYLKGDDNDDEYIIERVVLEDSTNPTWSAIELTVDDAHKDRALSNSETLVLSGIESLAAGYDYTFHVVFEKEDAPHVGCERGYTYFTLRIVPDVVTWYGGNWNVDFNWSSFIPLPETDVVLLPQNYNVTFSEDSIYDFNYVRNQCHNLYMPAGMSMAGQENLRINGQVFIDIPAKTWEWSLVSVPLQGIVTGDLFVSQSEGDNPFVVAPINQTVANTAFDRYTYEIYHSPYDAVHDKWHVPTNTLTRELHPTEAFMIGVDAEPDDLADTVVIRLPKPSNTYRYYDIDSHLWLDEQEDIVRDANYGKPAWNGESTIALKEVYGNVYLLGNPTFGHINITKLVEDNDDKLTGRYYMPDALVDEPSLSEMTTFTHNVASEEEDVLLPPCRGILLEGEGDPSDELIISISAKDITEPGFAPAKKVVKHAGSSFHPEGGVPIGAIRSAVTIDERSNTIEEELDVWHDGIIGTLNLSRELYRDGAYNTLCLPFDLSAAEIAAGPLTGAQLYEFVRAEKVSEDQLDIEIRATSSIVAGVPYLIKWAPTEPEVIPMPLVFHDVHIKDISGQTVGADDEVQFVGSIPRKLMVYEDRNNLFVGANNTLYWPNTNNPLRGFRAYFQVPEAGPVAVPKHTPARFIVRENTPTDMENVKSQKPTANCKKLIKNGRMIIIRNGEKYDVTGKKL
jgi:hypothetical protein